MNKETTNTERITALIQQLSGTTDKLIQSKVVYAVQTASTLCGENETQLFSCPIDAGDRYAELVADYLNQGDDLEIFEHTETEFYAENESTGTYDRIAVETLNIIS